MAVAAIAAAGVAGYLVQRRRSALGGQAAPGDLHNRKKEKHMTPAFARAKPTREEGPMGFEE